MDNELMQELNRINWKIDFYQWQLDFGGLDNEFKQVCRDTLEQLKDRKSSLNAFRLS